MPRTVAAGLVSVLLGALLAACSVSPQDHPETVVVGPLTAPLRSASAQGPSTGTGPVFFVRDGRLVAVDRRLPVGDPLEEAIDALVAGPSAQDPAGLHSAWPAAVTGLQAQQTDGLVSVAVPAAFDRLGARNEILAVGQLVFTAMAQPGVSGVRLTSNGTPIEVPIGSGELVARPVTRSDYAAVAPS